MPFEGVIADLNTSVSTSEVAHKRKRNEKTALITATHALFTERRNHMRFKHASKRKGAIQNENFAIKLNVEVRTTLQRKLRLL